MGHWCINQSSPLSDDDNCETRTPLLAAQGNVFLACDDRAVGFGWRRAQRNASIDQEAKDDLEKDERSTLYD